MQVKTTTLFLNMKILLYFVEWGEYELLAVNSDPSNLEANQLFINIYLYLLITINIYFPISLQIN
jgi:hypothetical protein